MSLCLSGSTQCLRWRKKKLGHTYTTPSLKVGSRAPFLPLLLTYGFTYFWNYLLCPDLLLTMVWYVMGDCDELMPEWLNTVLAVARKYTTPSLKVGSRAPFLPLLLTYGFTYFWNYLLYSDLLVTTVWYSSFERISACRSIEGVVRNLGTTHRHNSTHVHYHIQPS